MRVIFRLQPNRLGIKLRVEDGWHFRLLEDMFKTTNEITGPRIERKGYGPSSVLLGLSFLKLKLTRIMYEFCHWKVTKRRNSGPLWNIMSYESFEFFSV